MTVPISSDDDFTNIINIFLCKLKDNRNNILHSGLQAIIDEMINEAEKLKYLVKFNGEYKNS